MKIKGKKTGNKIRLSWTGVYRIKNGTKIATRVSTPLIVTAHGTLNPNTPQEECFTQVEFENRDGEWRTELVPLSMLAAQQDEFIKLLARRGYLWPMDRGVRNEIVAAVYHKGSNRTIKMTNVPGWNRGTFVLPLESYTPKGPDLENWKIQRNPSVQLGEFRRSGTLREWQRKIGNRCVHSSCARLAVAAVFAAPTLRVLNRDSFGINFSGPSSRGKTLLNRLACSVAGLNSESGPATWDSTESAFEQRALGHRDCVAPLEEISHLDGKVLGKLLVFRLAANRSKAKAGQYLEAHKLVEHDWRIIGLSTSEGPFWKQLDEKGRGLLRGEQARMINVPACLSDMEDIFDGPDASARIGRTSEARRRVVQRLAQRTREYQGEAFRTYLTKFVADHSAKERVQEYINEFEDSVEISQQHPGVGRITACFAVLYAGAALAIDYKVLRWSKEKTLEAIHRCLIAATDQWIAEASSNVSNENNLRLGEFKKLIDTATFVRLNPRRRKKGAGERSINLTNAHGIIRPLRAKPGKVECLLFRRTMDNWFPNANERSGLIKSLCRHHILGKGRRSNVRTRQVFITELGHRISCYRISRRKLAAAEIDVGTK